MQPFRTHVPLFSLRAAAGGLGDEMVSEAEDWVPAPEGMRLSPDLFVAHVVGRSMEPRIPDGSLNLFRLHPAGSRQGKILLIERFGVLDETARYTIKRYTSRKVVTGEERVAARADPAGAAEPRVRSVGRGAGRLRRRRRMAARHRVEDRDIGRLLLAWYARGHRDLPWRNTRDPYASGSARSCCSRPARRR